MNLDELVGIWVEKKHYKLIINVKKTYQLAKIDKIVGSCWKGSRYEKTRIMGAFIALLAVALAGCGSAESTNV